MSNEEKLLFCDNWAKSMLRVPEWVEHIYAQPVAEMMEEVIEKFNESFMKPTVGFVIEVLGVDHEITKLTIKIQEFLNMVLKDGLKLRSSEIKAIEAGRIIKQRDQFIKTINFRVGTYKTLIQ